MTDQLLKSGTTASVRSVERAIDLLTCLERAGQPMGVRELARVATIPRATVQRLLCVLEGRGFVQSQRGRYWLGPGVVPLASSFMSGDTLTRAALPVMQRLTALSGETTSLYVRQGFERVAVQRVNSPHPLRFTLNIGRRLPLHLGASGQVLAAALPVEELEQLLGQVREVPMATGGTLGRDELRCRLEAIRRRGFAVSREERLVGVVSLSTPVVVRGRGVVAALGVSGPASRMTDEKVEYLSAEIQHAAQEIAEAYSRM